MKDAEREKFERLFAERAYRVRTWIENRGPRILLIRDAQMLLEADAGGEWRAIFRWIREKLHRGFQWRWWNVRDYFRPRAEHEEGLDPGPGRRRRGR